MYLSRLEVEGFKCFGNADITFRYPGDGGSGPNNINIVLGDNGSGKSAILRAIALSTHGAVLEKSGLIPSWLVRRPGEHVGSLTSTCKVDEPSATLAGEPSGFVKNHYFFYRRKDSSLDAIDSSGVDERLQKSLFGETSSNTLLFGYGTARLVESGDFAESQRRQLRGLIYERVASLFEDQYTLPPILGAIARQLRHRREIVDIVNRLLPESVQMDDGRETTFDIALLNHDLETPFAQLSDGYRSFLGWIADLLVRMSDVCPVNSQLCDMSGIVLVDEIDLHLHPQWQRSIIPALTRALPRLQFIFTTHSPILLSSLRRENVHLAERLDDGSCTIRKLEERTFGRGIEQLLMSGYFGLSTPRSSEFAASANQLFDAAAEGDGKAALAYLEQLAKLPQDLEEVNSLFEKAQQKTKGNRPPQ